MQQDACAKPGLALGLETKEARAYARRIIDTVIDAVIIQDAGGTVTYANTAAQAMFGMSTHEMAKRQEGGYLAVTTPEGNPLPTSETPFARVARTRQPMHAVEYGYELVSGERIVIAANIAPLLDPSGSFEGAVTSARDITKRFELERELRRSNQELEQFAYVASHDLQEPLRMVSSYVQLLSRRYAGQLDNDAEEFIGYAVDGARRMQRLINDLLTYSRIGRQTNPFEAVDLDALLQRVTRSLSPAIADTNARIEVTNPPQVNGDEVQLEQLFRNLIGNAIKYSRTGVPPRIEINFEDRPSEWLARVRDNGIGIAKEHHERVFAIFQRLHARNEYSGTGIGLAICRRIVEQHHGSIWIESTPGEGTTVMLTLPRTTTEGRGKSNA